MPPYSLVQYPLFTAAPLPPTQINWKIIEVNGSYVSKRAPNENWPWWNPAAQPRTVLGLSFFVPVPTLKRQNPLLSYVRGRERKYTVNVQCSVQYTLLLLYLMSVMSYCPVPVAARSKAYVYGRSPAAIVISYPTGGMDVRLLCLLCVVR
jgi:hypothetical protein